MRNAFKSFIFKLEVATGPFFLAFFAKIVDISVASTRPLYLIVRYGCMSVAKKVMEGRGKRTVNANDVYERTPLHLAAQEGHDELVEFFLKKGAKIDRSVSIVMST